MDDRSTKAVLISILDLLKSQATYLHRQHGWIIAVSETIEKYPDLAAELKRHPFFDQGPRLDTHITSRFLETVDSLIQQLKLQA
jgi:hypothetical protein